MDMGRTLRTKCMLLVSVLGILITQQTVISGDDAGQPVKFTVSLAEASQRSKDGQEQLKRLEANGERHSCWKQAVDRLKGSCADLTDDSQGRLALSLTNCHLDQYGRQVYPCPDSSTLAECTKGMDPEAFNTLSTFTAHTSNVCFFLAGQLWQERTETTINSLASTSETVVEQLNESVQQNKNMLELQATALNNQQTLLSSGEELQKDLQDAHKEVKETRKEAEIHATLWQKNFGGLFDMLARNERWVTSIGLDWVRIKMALVYAVLIYLSRQLSAASFTSAARVWLLFDCLAGFILEYLYITLAVWWWDDTTRVLDPVPSAIRWAVIILGLVILAKTILEYKDNASLSYKRLERIENHIKQVKDHLNISGSDDLQGTEAARMPPAVPRSPTSPDLQARLPPSARDGFIPSPFSPTLQQCQTTGPAQGSSGRESYSEPYASPPWNSPAVCVSPGLERGSNPVSGSTPAPWHPLGVEESGPEDIDFGSDVPDGPAHGSADDSGLGGIERAAENLPETWLKANIGVPDSQVDSGRQPRGVAPWKARQTPRPASKKKSALATPTSRYNLRSRTSTPASAQ